MTLPHPPERQDNERLIPEGGENPYAQHPGFDAQGCHLQYVVTPAYLSSSHHGFGCEVTGGHCLPDNDVCSKRRIRFPVSINAEPSFRSIEEQANEQARQIVRGTFNSQGGF